MALKMHQFFLLVICFVNLCDKCELTDTRKLSPRLLRTRKSQQFEHARATGFYPAPQSRQEVRAESPGTGRSTLLMRRGQWRRPTLKPGLHIIKRKGGIRCIILYFNLTSIFENALLFGQYVMVVTDEKFSGEGLLEGYDENYVWIKGKQHSRRQSSFIRMPPPDFDFPN